MMIVRKKVIKVVRGRRSVRNAEARSCQPEKKAGEEERHSRKKKEISIGLETEID